MSVRIGVLGAGQLGRMLGEAALPLGMRATFLDPTPDPCAAAVGPVLRGAFEDPEALDRLAACSDVVTYEFENVPVAAVRHLAERVPVFPSPEALEVAQDRSKEKRAFLERGVETAPFVEVSSPEEVLAAIDTIGLPAILKTRRMGYDGKGQLYLADPEQAAPAFATLGGVPCILEQVVPFDRELSLLVARSRGGELATWPLVQNRHAGGILRWSYAPAEVDRDTADWALEIARTMAEGLGYVGVLAIELFDLGGRLLANEMAPRVHNSGHWSIEGAETSQFENHLRAIAGLPLGGTGVPLPVACVNLLGRIPPLPDLLSVPGARVHLYGKSPRPGRKLGHVTVRGAGPEEVRQRLDRVRRLVEH